MEIKKLIAELKQKFDEAGGLKHVYFVACGGSKAAIFPGLYLLQSEAKTFSASTYNSNEFVHAMPKQLGKQTLAIICSLKATAETVKAVEAANAAGAITIAMTGNEHTGMAKVGQYVVTYSNGDDQIYSQSNQATVLRIGFELLHQFEGYENYEKAMQAYSVIDEIVAKPKRSICPLPQPGPKSRKTSRCSTCSPPAPTTASPTPWSAAILWRCSGSTLYACTTANISTARLRRPTNRFPWFF